MAIQTTVGASPRSVMQWVLSLSPMVTKEVYEADRIKYRVMTALCLRERRTFLHEVSARPAPRRTDPR